MSRAEESDDSRKEVVLTVAGKLLACVSRDNPVLLLHASVDINEQNEGQTLGARAISNGSRGISDRQILIIINGGHRESEPTSAVSAERWRYTGMVDGRRITVIATESETDIVVITAY